jgi:hypothetical protein
MRILISILKVSSTEVSKRPWVMVVLVEPEGLWKFVFHSEYVTTRGKGEKSIYANAKEITFITWKSCAWGKISFPVFVCVYGSTSHVFFSWYKLPYGLFCGLLSSNLLTQ